MAVSFDKITIWKKYSRPYLATIWGYKAYQAIARGVVTPRGTNFIILFVTEEKQGFQEQYQDNLSGEILEWEGPTDHFAEQRMVNVENSSDEIHVFHRSRHHSDFTYLGPVTVKKYNLFSDKPSKFVFALQFTSTKTTPFHYAEELPDDSNFSEGAKQRVTVNKYERDPKARAECIRIHGYTCRVCNFEFEQVYGELGREYIHVHHLVPLKDIGDQYTVDPAKDMIPVCPNCHTMLHKLDDPGDVDMLKEILSKQQRRK